MKLPDVDVLVQAFRSDTPSHQRCRAWLEAAINGPANLGMSPLVLSGVIRVATHPRVFVKPSTVRESLAFAEFLLKPPAVVIVEPGDRHWSIFTGLCRGVEAKGNLVPDAWFAALAIESGCEWVTLDRDFARFDDLQWSVP